MGPREARRLAVTPTPTSLSELRLRGRRRFRILESRAQPCASGACPSSHGAQRFQAQEVPVNHFGIAFGIITASAIGGALLFDHSLKNAEVKAPHVASNVAPGTSAPADTAPPPTTETRESPVKVADAGAAAAPTPSR